MLDKADARGQIKDRLGLLEARARLALALQQWEEAESLHRLAGGRHGRQAGGAAGAVAAEPGKHQHSPPGCA